MNPYIIALGDSLTQGYPFHIDCSWVNILTREHGWHIDNKGINGETTGEMYERFYQDVIQKEAQAVVITGGANDVYEQTAVEITLQNYQYMIEMAIANNVLPVVGLTLPIDEPMFEEKLKILRSELRKIAIACNLPLIDFYSSLVDAVTGLIAQDYDYDGVHPNLEGYRKMAETAKPVLEKVISRIMQYNATSIMPGIYQHYKGNTYKVLGVAKHSETMEDLVVYQALYGERGLWVRPLKMFTETLCFEGKQVKRFAYVKKLD